MKMKLIGILVCLMLMTAFLTTAQNVENKPIRDDSDEFEQISFDKVEVPVWEVGDKFAYKADNFTIDFEETNLSLYMDVKIDNLPLEVIDDDGDFYNLTFYAIINGSFWFSFDAGNGPIIFSFELKGAIIEGYIIVRKADLALKEIYCKISGNFGVNIIKQPYFYWPFEMQKDIDGIIKFDIEFENARQPIVKYPFELPECWGLPKENFTLNLCTIESPFFDTIDYYNKNFVNPLLIILNKIINGPRISRLLDFSNILLDILPIVDICYILNNYTGRGCNFTSPAIPPIICCLSKEWITVPAGTFECYNISILGTNLGNIYYNETVGAIVKVIGNFQDIIPSISNINMELLSYDV